MNLSFDGIVTNTLPSSLNGSSQKRRSDPSNGRQNKRPRTHSAPLFSAPSLFGGSHGMHSSIGSMGMGPGMMNPFTMSMMNDSNSSLDDDGAIPMSDSRRDGPTHLLSEQQPSGGSGFMMTDDSTATLDDLADSLRDVSQNSYALVDFSSGSSTTGAGSSMRRGLPARGGSNTSSASSNSRPMMMSFARVRHANPDRL